MKGELKGGYRFDNNPDKVFEKYLEEHNTFARCLDQKAIQKGSIFSHAFGALNYQNNYQNPDLIVTIACTLPELYQGVAKKCEYKRKVLIGYM
jgi:DnaJ-class molecular chaperone